MKALSLRNPWPVYILDHLGLPTWKGIENRSRLVFGPKFFNQVILIHVSKNMEEADWTLAMEWSTESGVRPEGQPSRTNLEFGGIIGQTVVLDVIPPDGNHPRANDSWWMPGHFGYILDPVRTKRLPFIPCKGSQGLWDVPIEVEQQL